MIGNTTRNNHFGGKRDSNTLGITANGGKQVRNGRVLLELIQ